MSSEAPPPVAAEPHEPLRAAPPPPRAGGSTVVGVVVALALLCLGAVAVRDGLVLGGQIDGSAWTRQVVEDLDGRGSSVAVALLGGVVVLVGLWLVVTALRPHTSAAAALESSTGVVLRPLDVARVSTTAAERVDGVLSARTTVTRRKAVVRLRATSSDGVGEAVRAAVTDRLSALATPPSVQVVVSAPTTASSRAGART